jgi:hypothetical protein
MTPTPADHDHSNARRLPAIAGRCGQVALTVVNAAYQINVGSCVCCPADWWGRGHLGRLAHGVLAEPPTRPSGLWSRGQLGRRLGLWPYAVVACIAYWDATGRA